MVSGQGFPQSLSAEACTWSNGLVSTFRFPHYANRAGESFAEAIESYTGIAFSLKEYEDIAIEFARNERNIRIWREHLHRKRVTETLFDTPVSPTLSLYLFLLNLSLCRSYGHKRLRSSSKRYGKPLTSPSTVRQRDTTSSHFRKKVCNSFSSP